jgi:hypothetical protein
MLRGCLRVEVAILATEIAQRLRNHARDVGYTLPAFRKELFDNHWKAKKFNSPSATSQVYHEIMR